MKIKVCGMRHIENINELDALAVHFIGLNFYDGSKRYVDHTKACFLSNYNGHPKVGVFVNARKRYLLDMVKIYNLSLVQLHGDENPDYVEAVRKEVKVIKVFSIKNAEDFAIANEYENCDFFLFDTKGMERGGNGVKFDWQLLAKYKGTTKFFLAGGISPEDAIAIKTLNHPQFAGIDINSGFETEPGLKDINLIKKFIDNLKI